MEAGSAVSTPSTIHLVCQSCGAGLTTEPNVRTVRCPYCELPSVVERPPMADRPDPVFTIGFRLTHEEARERASRWLKGRTIFARRGVHRARLRREDMKGVYAPVYLYSATARADFTAEIGEEYYETVGRGKNRRREKRWEWRPLSGSYGAYVSDIIVTASKGLLNHALERIEPYDLRQLMRYHPAIIAGWVAEDASLSPSDCLTMAREGARALVSEKLRRFMPGDRHRALKHHTAFDRESLDLALVPVWLLAVRYHPKRPPMQILVNGQTGKVFGAVPLSWVKITFTVLALLVAVLVVLYFTGQLPVELPGAWSPR